MTVPPQFVPKGGVYKDEADKLRLESRNGLIQAAFVFDAISNWPKGKPIDSALLLELQRLAVNQIYRCAGYFRDGPVTLGVDHLPPDFTLVPALVEEMCSYINAQWGAKTPVHLSAYAMWRLNWIHPFFGGNGRTARAFSYLILCLALGFSLPAKEKNIPEFIEENPGPYYEALRAADAALAKHGQIDVSAMEEMLESLLAKQLLAVHSLATGKPSPI